MNFSYSEEQQMLAETVTRWLAAETATQRGFSPERWSELAELGLLGLHVDEEHGGLGGTSVETLIVMQEFGRALFAQPFVSTAVVAASLLGSVGSAAQRNDMLPRIANGSLRLALATLEPGARFDLADIKTTAVRRGDSYVLNGRKAVVVHGDSAHVLIVSARTSGDQHDKDGLTLFSVDATAAGVTVRGFPTLDGQRAAEVSLENVHVPLEAVLGEIGSGYVPLEWALDRGIAALCAEAVGAMERLMEMTAEHLRTRKQFGQPIGRFQALQHRLADMQIAVEQARSMALQAAALIDHPERSERRKALSAAKAMIGRSGQFVGQQAVQLHGGMGMTAELTVGNYFKRLTCIDMTWGNTDHHVELYGELL
jgi:alkylation response protein AidB-like acyl-CoA dehydrogenase